MLTDKDPATGEYRIPHIIYSDAYLLRDGRLRRSGAARHDLSGALGLHLAARSADRRRGGRRRRDPPAGGAARSRRAPVPGRADRSRRAARSCPGFVKDDGSAQVSRTTPTTSSITSARPASARSPAGAAPTATAAASARPIRDQSKRYIENRLLLAHEIPPRGALLTSMPTAPISSWRGRHGLHRPAPSRSCCSSTASRCRSSASPPRATARSQPPDAASRARRDTISIRCRSGIAPFEQAAANGGVSAARDHAAADGDVPLLGLAERLAAADPRPEPAVHASPRPRAALGIADDDWVWVISRTAASKCRRS